MIKNIKLIAFDLDGTLVDSMPSYAKIAAQVIEKHYNMPVKQAQEAYYRTSGIPFQQQLQEIFPGNAQNSAAAEEYEQQKLAYLHEHGFDLEPAVYRALLKMQDEGYLLAISTSNSPEAMECSTDRWPIQFDAALPYEGENFQKGLTHFQWLAEHFEIELSEMLFVGDSLDDYGLAHAAGVKFVAVLGTFKQADFAALSSEIICLPDIPSLLKQLPVI